MLWGSKDSTFGKCDGEGLLLLSGVLTMNGVVGVVGALDLMVVILCIVAFQRLGGVGCLGRGGLVCTEHVHALHANFMWKAVFVNI